MSERSISPFERYGEPRPDSDAALQVHIVTATDTITGVAQRYYGDWRLWRVIADRNAITDVRIIPPGTAVLIPRRPLETGRYESA